MEIALDNGLVVISMSNIAESRISQISNPRQIIDVDLKALDLVNVIEYK
ncbi:hypothetical protein M2451_001215 [Dysgonomonas sp. PFB1-18]|nr:MULTISPECIES: hypothetical protein [unclassified Dysgonomonas]MDH6308160.1 hypothetical protein [Dysgonomonas sp. PF1-14]MDH6338401.1 hypothetical protein [Dysgonomonas sp. PF1-16]MDH6379898.1 hypothetical protein [Dysgonomonas sp. PFB1-18]MDH6397012.1 hypothetical protein [Dysgonomonas sp. PF1-23]